MEFLVQLSTHFPTSSLSAEIFFDEIKTEDIWVGGHPQPSMLKIQDSKHHSKSS
jgi:hypothetical protein